MSTIRIRNRWFLLLDVLLCAGTPALALLLRLEGANGWTAQYVRGIVLYTVISLIVKIPVFYRYNLYNHHWHYAGINELLSIASATGVVMTRMIIVVVIERVIDIFPTVDCPLSVPFIDGLLTLVALLVSRFNKLAFATIRAKGRTDGSRRAQTSSHRGSRRCRLDDRAGTPT